jgi:hypothetical protein
MNYDGPEIPNILFTADGITDRPMQVNNDEYDRIQHEIKMTDDPIYREWYRKEQKRIEIEEQGIDE